MLRAMTAPSHSGFFAFFAKFFFHPTSKSVYNPEMSSLPSIPDARRRAALGAGAELRLGAGLAALILALLVRLFGRSDAAWHALPEHAYDRANQAGACPYAIVKKAIVTSAIGRAPHAAWIESGRVPDWILPGIRNRGMRPAAPPARQRPRALPARAPPGAHPLPC